MISAEGDIAEAAGVDQGMAFGSIRCPRHGSFLHFARAKVNRQIPRNNRPPAGREGRSFRKGQRGGRKPKSSGRMKSQEFFMISDLKSGS
jgi:hypothetical protein